MTSSSSTVSVFADVGACSSVSARRRRTRNGALRLLLAIRRRRHGRRKEDLKTRRPARSPRSSGRSRDAAVVLLLLPARTRSSRQIRRGANQRPRAPGDRRARWRCADLMPDPSARGAWGLPHITVIERRRVEREGIASSCYRCGMSVLDRLSLGGGSASASRPGSAWSEDRDGPA